eukprot:SAG11_NODE_2672_length_3110_cov_2.425108_2_plen_37_part_00
MRKRRRWSGMAKGSVAEQRIIGRTAHVDYDGATHYP